MYENNQLLLNRYIKSTGEAAQESWSSSTRELSQKTSKAAGSFPAALPADTAGSLCTLQHKPGFTSTRPLGLTHGGKPFHLHSNTAWHKLQRSAAFYFFFFSPKPSGRVLRKAKRISSRHDPGNSSAAEEGRPRGAAVSHLFVLEQDLGQGPPEAHGLPGRGADELVRSQHGHGACGEENPREHRSRPGAPLGPLLSGESPRPRVPPLPALAWLWRRLPR